MLLGHLAPQQHNWEPPSTPGAAPALTDEEREAGKYYAWNESNYQSDPSNSMGSDHT